jgi:hypothetical protein
MTKLLEHAVDTVRALPPAMQDDLARLLLQFAGEEQPVIQLMSIGNRWRHSRATLQVEDFRT